MEAARENAARPRPRLHFTDSRALLFVSDLHLSEALPRTVAMFERFVAEMAQDTGAVFLLGDIFEYWIGDDTADTPFALGILRAMRTLAERGIALYLMQGNRDFLLGECFARAARATLLPDPCLIEAFGQRVVLTHGDALCTLDLDYQRLRRVVRNRMFQRGFLRCPPAWRRALARRLRSKSAARPDPMAPRYDVTRAAVNLLLARMGGTSLIHGHTHRPARHEEGMTVRWVLPDWEFDHADARGGYLRMDKHETRLVSLAGQSY